MKGVHPFISATILILVTVVIATIVSSWTVNVTSDRAKTIINATQTKLNCQYAGFLVRNVTYDCSGACFTGSPYRINATIDNTGSNRILVEDMLLSLANGIAYHLSGNLSSISTGDIVTKLFDTITINTSSKIPTETMDVREAYVNGTNTIGLWHFDEGSGNTTSDASRVNTGTLYNGSTVCNNSTNQCPVWNASSQFGYGITFDGINDYILLDSRNFSNVSGTAEAWVNMQNNNPSNNYTIFSTPSEISNTDDGLVGLWHFSQNSTASGGVKDSTSYGNNGTATNDPIYTNEGRFQTAWTFDGINDHINVSSGGGSLNIFGNITVSAWVNIRSLSNNLAAVAAKNNNTDGWTIEKQTLNNRLAFGVSNGTNSNPTISTRILTANTWYHVVGTYDASNAKIYVNGEVDATSAYTGGLNNAGTTMIIGTTPQPDATRYFNGTIDEVAIYNRSLSAAEIRDRYLGGLSLHKMTDDLRFVAGNLSLSYNISSWSGWHHVGGTYTSSAATLYADGAPVNASSNRGMVILGNNSFIGGMNGTIAFNGTIDEVRVSNMSRSFNVTLQYNVTLPDISAVRVYNYSNALVASDTSLGGVARYNKTLSGLPISEYRIEAEDSSGHRVERWYPYKPGGACVATTQLDKIQFSTANCPEITDTYQGTDVTFVRCVG